MEILELLSILSILCITIFTIFKFSNNDTLRARLPPGPPKLPLIGNIHQLVSRTTLPHHRLAELARKYGPIMYLQLGEVPTTIVSSADLAEETLKKHDAVFANRPKLLVGEVLFNNYTDIGFAPFGEYWRRIRKLCTLELLSVKRIQMFRRLREEEVTDLIRQISLEEGSVVNLSKKLFDVSFNITSRLTFNKRGKDQEEFSTLAKEIIDVSSGFFVADLYPSFKLLRSVSGITRKLKEMALKSDKLLDKIINDHMSIKRPEGEEEDFVEVLLKFLDDRKDAHYSLTLDNVKSIILDIFTAGSETTSTIIEWTMSELLKNPMVMEKVQAEVREIYQEQGTVQEINLHKLKYLKMVIKETLRLHPPGPLLVPRESIEKCEIHGFDIPQGTRLIVNAWAIGRDQKYWQEPEKFYPERFEGSLTDFKGSHFELIPFGAGRRMCPGMLLSIANIELQLAMLLYHFDWKLPNDLKLEDLNMNEAFGLSVRRKNELLVIPTTYEHSNFKEPNPTREN